MRAHVNATHDCDMEEGPAGFATFVSDVTRVRPEPNVAVNEERLRPDPAYSSLPTSPSTALAVSGPPAPRPEMLSRPACDVSI